MSIEVETGVTNSVKHEAVTRAMTAFRRAADQRDIAALEDVLCRDFRVIFAVGDGVPTTLPRAQYLDMVRAGKTGGAERTLSVRSLDRVGAFATATASMERPDAAFEGLYTFVEEDGRWRLLQEAVRMTPRPR